MLPPWISDVDEVESRASGSVADDRREPDLIFWRAFEGAEARVVRTWRLSDGTECVAFDDFAEELAALSDSRRNVVSMTAVGHVATATYEWFTEVVPLRVLVVDRIENVRTRRRRRRVARPDWITDVESAESTASGTVPYGPSNSGDTIASWLLSDGTFCIALGELARDISERDVRQDDPRIGVTVFGHVATVHLDEAAWLGGPSRQAHRRPHRAADLASSTVALLLDRAVYRRGIGGRGGVSSHRRIRNRVPVDHQRRRGGEHRVWCRGGWRPGIVRWGGAALPRWRRAGHRCRRAGDGAVVAE